MQFVHSAQKWTPFFMTTDNKTLNIESIKRHGTMLGLEAEFKVHRDMMDSRFKERHWERAAHFAGNCKIICDELLKLSTESEPCVLTSPDKSSMPSSTD
jgi:hypothetical protein